jgi:hypothetical protein
MPTQPKIRHSLPNDDVDALDESIQNDSVASSDEKSPKKTPNNKVPVTKRSTVRSVLKIKVSNKVTNLCFFSVNVDVCML